MENETVRFPAELCEDCNRPIKTVGGHRIYAPTDESDAHIRWKCQACSRIVCKLCGAPTQMPMGRDVVGDDGCVSHFAIFPVGSAGCVNADCANHRVQAVERPPTRLAIVYDFDGTLSPQPMQEYTVLPELGIEGADFWRRVNDEARANGAEPMLVYMRLMLEEAATRKQALSKGRLRALGGRIPYFPGVRDWFAHINRIAAGLHVQLDHYIVSAGNKEILDGVAIAKHFRRIYASEYHWNEQDEATFPKVLVTDTTKTQFLFRINKGREDLHQSVNEHMPEADRSVPFQNILYLGDGQTDVPGMRVTRANGGRAIAVYPQGSERQRNVCRQLVLDGRADFAAEANYHPGERLERLVVKTLKMMAARITLEDEREANP